MVLYAGKNFFASNLKQEEGTYILAPPHQNLRKMASKNEQKEMHLKALKKH